MSRTVDLTEHQTAVLGLINRYKCLSSAEMAYWRNDLTEKEIDEAIPTLIRERLVYLSHGGYPKRYCPYLVEVEETFDEEPDDPDASYELEC